jgi:hypothetical protein
MELRKKARITKKEKDRWFRMAEVYIRKMKAYLPARMISNIK